MNTSALEAARAIDAKLLEHSISGRGLHDFFADAAHRAINPGVILLPATAHYSLIKVAGALGLGKNQIESIPVDEHFRMDLGSLEKCLEDCCKRQRPVIALVAILGNTEEGAVDQIHEVMRLQDEFRRKGLEFYLHCDGAWGGYVKSLFYDEDGNEVSQPGSIVKSVRMWPSDEVFKSFRAVSRADSVTIDPHKLGYVPYPCGAIVFKNSHARDLISFNEAYYVFREEDEKEQPFIGRFILEGSKPGAAAAACWLAHKVVPLNQSGYGKLIGKSIQGAQELNLKCKDLTEELKRHSVCLHVITDPPDINLFCFVVNKTVNSSLAEMNNLNTAIYERLRFNPDEVVQRHKFIISSTIFSFAQYGKPTARGSNSMEGHLAQVGIRDPVSQFNEVGQIKILRCTVTSPWIALSRGGSPDYVEQFAIVLKEVILSCTE